VRAFGTATRLRGVATDSGLVRAAGTGKVGNAEMAGVVAVTLTADELTMVDFGLITRPLSLAPSPAACTFRLVLIVFVLVLFLFLVVAGTALADRSDYASNRQAS
jgi:hypothetical protein